MTEDTFEVRRTILEGPKGPTTVFVVARTSPDGNVFYFNYAYEDEEQAKAVRTNLARDRLDRMTDLSFNYVGLPRVLGVEQRTNQKKNWWIKR